MLIILYFKNNNKNKSEILSLKMDKILRIYLTNEAKDLYNENYKTLLKRNF